MSTPNSQRPSSLMLEESFAAADDRFLDEWNQFNGPDFLTRFLERWLADTRLWSRQQLIRYLQQDLNFPGHEVVVKRMCKHFYSARDHELLAHFMVAFDRIVRRQRRKVLRWNRETRQYIPNENLLAKPNKTIQNETGRTVERGYGKFKSTVRLPDCRNKSSNRLFSHRTRNHLRRKVWRFFRWLSYRDADAYLSSMATAIIQYIDNDFTNGENIIDNWSLMHVGYFHSDMLRFGASHVNLQPGKSLADLSAAPYQPELWQRPESSQHLLRIVGEANSVLARIWAMEMLLRDHREATQRIDIPALLQLLRHTDPRVRQFASEIFSQHPGLPNLSVTTWLELINRTDHSVLPMICAAMKKYVSVARLDTPQLVQLTLARPVAVAEFGFEILKARHNERPLTNTKFTELSQVRCEAVAAAVTLWALSEFDGDRYQTDHVVEFFDALSEPVRTAAMTWLEQPESQGYNDPALWARLIETPFEDVRLRLVECLHRRTSLPGAEADHLAPIWCAVILGVHRGGRTKLKAIAQIQAAILNQPARSSELLPVLAVAIRSLRLPERRTALAAAASLVVQNQLLQAEFQRLVPELQWIDVSA